MKIRILLLIIFTTLMNQGFASFPIDNDVVGSNNDPTTDSWIPIVIALWLLILTILILLIRLVKRSLKRN